MHVFKQGFVWIGILLLVLLCQSLDHAYQPCSSSLKRGRYRGLRVTTAGKRRINRAQIRHRTHVYLIGAYGHHGGGGSAFQWHQRHHLVVTPYQINHAQGLDVAAAIAFDENADFVVIANVFRQSGRAPTHRCRKAAARVGCSNNTPTVCSNVLRCWRWLVGFR